VRKVVAVLQIIKKCDVMIQWLIGLILLSIKKNSSAGSSSGRNEEVKNAGMVVV
jgi:hypothetical protein